jgi:hypothetical protein
LSYQIWNPRITVALPSKHATFGVSSGRNGYWGKEMNASQERVEANVKANKEDILAKLQANRESNREQMLAGIEAEWEAIHKEIMAKIDT